MNNLKKLTENSYISSTDLTENISKFLFKNAKNFNNGSPININITGDINLTQHITENNFLSENGKKYYAEENKYLKEKILTLEENLIKTTTALEEKIIKMTTALENLQNKVDKIENNKNIL